MIVKQANRFKKPAAAPAPPVTKDCAYCASSIPIKAVRCPFCTSDLVIKSAMG
jgi:large conductance mechanosensitive channel